VQYNILSKIVKEGMSVDKNKLQMMPFYKDLAASTVLGAIAGFFAVFVAKSLGFINQVYFGVYLNSVVIFSLFVFICMIGILVGRLLGKYVSFLYNFVKFGEAGGLNWLVDIGIVNILIIITGQSAGIYFILFKGFSFIVAATNSYFWSKLWVFYGSKKQNEGSEISKFAIATLLGLLINVTIATTISYLGPSLFSNISKIGWANIAVIAGSLTAMLFNFTLYKLWVFKDK